VTSDGTVGSQTIAWRTLTAKRSQGSARPTRSGESTAARDRVGCWKDCWLLQRLDIAAEGEPREYGAATLLLQREKVDA
jgi:hypothetical protein